MESEEEVRPVKWVVESREEFRRKYPKLSGRHEGTEEGEHIITIPAGASTRTRLHELAHAKLGHLGPTRTFHESAQRELLADAWAYEKLGVRPTWREAMGDLNPMVRELVEKGYRVNQIYSWVRSELQEAGYHPDKDAKSAIWWWIRSKYGQVKGKEWEF